MLPVVPIRRCGGGGVLELEWCAGVVSVVVSFFEFFISPLLTRRSCCLSCLFGDARMAGHVDWVRGGVVVWCNFEEFLLVTLSLQ